MLLRRHYEGVRGAEAGSPPTPSPGADAELAAARAEVARLRAENEQASRAVQEATAEVERLDAALRLSYAERDGLALENEALRSELDQVRVGLAASGGTPTEPESDGQPVAAAETEPAAPDAGGSESADKSGDRRAGKRRS